MILQEIFRKYSFDTVFGDLVEMIPDLSRKRQAMLEAYDFVLSVPPVASKKRITYELIDSEDYADTLVGAEDRHFQANWNVVVGKEVVVDDEAEITPREIAANAFLCILLLGFQPRRFESLCEELRAICGGSEE